MNAHWYKKNYLACRKTGGGGGGGGKAPTFSSPDAADAFLSSAGFQASLTGDDRTAIAHYTGSGFGHMNKVMRESLLYNTDLPPKVKGQVDKLNKALDKYPGYKGSVVRNIKINEQHVDAFMSAYKKGGKVTLPSFTSTTVKPQGTFSGNVRYIINSKGKAGKAILKHSQFPSEREVLFKNTAKFKVGNVTSQKAPSHSGYKTWYTIHLNEV